jgi:hypothetical protein
VIDYANVQRGDILRLVGAGAPGYAKLGDLLRVTEVFPNGVKVEDRRGEPCEFVFNCGAARLEPTEWKSDFPDQSPAPAAAAPEPA